MQFFVLDIIKQQIIVIQSFICTDCIDFLRVNLKLAHTLPQ
jgi:hypothetical protein